MSITKERFAQGMSFQQYLDQMTRNRERLEENYNTVQLSDEQLAFFKDLPQPLNVVVIAEDWCGDVINNLPVLARLAEASGKLNLSIFLRDQNHDLMNQYLKDGQHMSIPVFVFFDQSFNELGHFIERPEEISRLQGEYLAKLFATDPAFAGVEPGASPATLPDAARNRMMQAFGEFRAQHREQSDREVVRELHELLDRGLSQARGQ